MPGGRPSASPTSPAARRGRRRGRAHRRPARRGCRDRGDRRLRHGGTCRGRVRRGAAPDRRRHDRRSVHARPRRPPPEAIRTCSPREPRYRHRHRRRRRCGHVAVGDGRREQLAAVHRPRRPQGGGGGVASSVAAARATTAVGDRDHHWRRRRDARRALLPDRSRRRGHRHRPDLRRHDQPSAPRRGRAAHRPAARDGRRWRLDLDALRRGDRAHARRVPQQRLVPFRVGGQRRGAGTRSPRSAASETSGCSTGPGSKQSSSTAGRSAIPRRWPACATARSPWAARRSSSA